MGQSILDPPSVEGWYTGREWINSGLAAGKDQLRGDHVADTSLPGVQSIVNDMRNAGISSPEELLEASLEHMGFLEISEETRQQLLDHAKIGGNMDGATRTLPAPASARCWPWSAPPPSTSSLVR